MSTLSPILHIIRGVSGSGKTTLAKEMQWNIGGYYFEADMWFCRLDGTYAFNPADLSQAHKWCFEQVCKEIDLGNHVIVSNTFTRLWEMRNYIDYALDHGYRVHIVTCHGRYQNTHGLTQEMVDRQAARFQTNKEIAAELKHDWNRYGRITYVNY
jgi:predicted kinase